VTQTLGSQINKPLLHLRAFCGKLRECEWRLYLVANKKSNPLIELSKQDFFYFSRLHQDRQKRQQHVRHRCGCLLPPRLRRSDFFPVSEPNAELLSTYL
jgi:hypothetical protein